MRQRQTKMNAREQPKTLYNPPTRGPEDAAQERGLQKDKDYKLI